MKKYALFLLPLLVVTGCSNPLSKSPDTFPEYYKANVSAQIKSVESLLGDLGMNDSFHGAGTFSFSGELPDVASGSLSTTYVLQSDTKNTQLALTDVSASWGTLFDSTSLTMKSLDMLTARNGDVFFRYQDLLLGGFPEEANKVITAYAGKWLDVKQSEQLADLPDQESRMIQQMSSYVSLLTLKDVEKYLHDFPVWKETKNLGMSGSLQGYEVALDNAQVIALADRFYKDATGSGLADADREEIENNLSQIAVTGNMWFDQKNPRYGIFEGTIASTDDSDASAVTFRIEETPEQFQLTSSADENVFTLVYTRAAADARTLLLTLSQQGTEIASLNGTYTTDSGSKKADVTIQAQGMTVTFTASNNADGTFVGTLNAGIANMSWEGAKKEGTLTAFSLKGAAIGSTLALDLLPSETESGFLVGDLVVRSSGTESFKANVKLLSQKEHFALLVNLVDMSDVTRSAGNIALDVTLDTLKKLSGNIAVPTDSVAFTQFIEELDSAMMSGSDFSQMDFSQTDFSDEASDDSAQEDPLVVPQP